MANLGFTLLAITGSVFVLLTVLQGALIVSYARSQWYRVNQRLRQLGARCEFSRADRLEPPVKPRPPEGR